MTKNPAHTILAWGQTTPEAIAVASAHVTMTYAELADTTRRMASMLRKLGVRPGNVVAIRARPELEAVLTLAVMHEGAVSLHGGEAVLAVYPDEIDFLLETDRQPLNLADAPPPEQELAIADFAMQFMHDGCTVQTGIGGIPSQVA
ncbi:MAG: AMP-binding protein, partial [Rhodoglobus sp.]